MSKRKVGLTMKAFKFFLPLTIVTLATSCSFGDLQVVEPTDINLNASELELVKDETFQLKATVSPSNSTNKNIVWSISSGATYVSVSESGMVKALKAGSATVRAKIKDTSIYKTCRVTVVNELVPLEGISFDDSSTEVTEGRNITVTPTYTPSNATHKTVTWSSSNKNVATVENGNIKGVHPGTATITATSTEGGYTASINVTVNEKVLDAYTILIYMCGADLESNYANQSEIEVQDDWGRTQTYEWDWVGLACSDILEILKVSGQPNDVNIVIQTGGAKEWTTNASALKSEKFHARYGDEDISSSYLQRWHVENQKIVKDGNNLTYASMGAATTLQSFLEYGLNYYPAEKTGVILWNHGGGLQGACFDEKKNDDSLEPGEILTAVDSALSRTGNAGKKLEWIGYDCCLMQVQDIAYLSSDYFNYMIASEESESGYGWDYDTWIDDLYSYKSTENILKSIVDGFIEDNNYDDYGRYVPSSNDQTLSYLDLKYASEYQAAWENMAKQLKNKIKSTNKSDFGNLVESCKYYGDSYYYVYGLFDAKDFINKLSNDSTFNPGTTYTNAVKTAHSKFVKYSQKGNAAGESYGVTMFWNISTIGSYWQSYTTYEYNSYSSDYGFPNWDYLNKNFGGTN